jgi:hypothetical protein
VDRLAESAESTDASGRLFKLKIFLYNSLGGRFACFCLDGGFVVIIRASVDLVFNCAMLMTPFLIDVIVLIELRASASWRQGPGLMICTSGRL